MKICQISSVQNQNYTSNIKVKRKNIKKSQTSTNRKKKLALTLVALGVAAVASIYFIKSAKGKKAIDKLDLVKNSSTESIQNGSEAVKETIKESVQEKIQETVQKETIEEPIQETIQESVKETADNLREMIANKKSAVFSTTLKNGDAAEVVLEDGKIIKSERKGIINFIKEYGRKENDVYKADIRTKYQNGKLKTAVLKDGTRLEFDVQGHILKKVKPDGQVSTLIKDSEGAYDDFARLADNYLGDNYCLKFPDGSREFYDGRFSDRSMYGFDILKCEYTPEGINKRYRPNGSLKLVFYPDNTSVGYYNNGQMMYTRDQRKWFREDGILSAAQRKDGKRFEYKIDGVTVHRRY